MSLEASARTTHTLVTGVIGLEVRFIANQGGLEA